MIRPINCDPIRLMQPSTPASFVDKPLFQDLKDTLKANSHKCVGMAANMIGVNKNIIIVHTEKGEDKIMCNPVIINQKGPYDTEEGCMSLPGVRKTTRYRVVTIRYEDENFKKQIETFSGFTAEIVQHEMDHLKGILI